MEPDSLIFPWQQSRQKGKIPQRKATRSSLDLEKAFTRSKTSTARVAVHKGMQNNMKRIWRAKINTRNTKKKQTTEKAKMSDLNCQIILKFEVSVAHFYTLYTHTLRKRVLARISKVRFHWRKNMNKLASLALLRVSASVHTKVCERKHAFPLKEIVPKRTEK